MRVTINGLKPLIMNTIVEFEDGSEIEATLVYEKLRNYCKACYMLDHTKEDCPLVCRELSRRGLDSHSTRFNERKELSRAPSEERRRENAISDSSSRSRWRSSSSSGISRHRAGHQTERSRRFRETGGAIRRRDERDSLRVSSREDSSRRSGSTSGPDLRSSLSRRHSVSDHQQSQRHQSPSQSLSRHGETEAPLPKDKGKGKLVDSSPDPRNTSGLRLDGLNPGFPFSSSSAPLLPPLAPKEALDVAMGELREVMTQYANCPDPTESAARRERVRQAEELGEFEETAEQMVRAAHSSLPLPPGELLSEGESLSLERIPASQRLGPTFADPELPAPKRRMVKKKLGRPPGKKSTPSKLAGVKSKKKKLLSQQTIPFPRRRLNMEQVASLEEAGDQQPEGQLINKQKSSVFFSRRTSTEIRINVKKWLQIDREGGVGKYLGLPELFGQKKKDLFASIVDRIRQKAISWSSRFLSSAGKMVMLKSVLTAIPTYAMSCFQLPASLCDRIQSALTRFWWDKNDQQKKMCWISWEKMARPKQTGGLGFKNVKLFLWKAVSGAVPSGYQLATRIPAFDPSCSRCSDLESTAHILFNCQFAQRVWKMAPLEAIQDAKEWQAAQEPNFAKPCRVPVRVPTLRKNPLSLVIHTDASWDSSSKASGLGWTLSFPGCPFKKNSALCEHVSSPLAAESLAVRTALLSAVSLGYQDIQLFSDCQILVKAILSKSLLVEIHGILLDIFECTRRLNNFSCCFLPRSSNVVADALAKKALALYSQNI
ncbi:unnamed protein product [Arabidopsis arenosa]|uniref:RNase H type-1 domain-containing protein n=1 Tax=Arabidopsis arenosa TaxID=38785 RepID=A0A8S1ZM02_ARAAE|nr:unnamed protein product [Arabidopsis arenosa]